MVKKNTLLYIDSELVELAKKNGLNISHLTEEAIRLQVSVKDFTPPEYLKNLVDTGRARWLPFPLKTLALENVGPFKTFTAEFDKQNLIIGPNASGKTTLIRSISRAFCYHGCIPEERGKITLTVQAKEMIAITIGKERTGHQCLLIDDGLTILPTAKLETFLDYIKKIDTQLILTTPPRKDLKTVGFKVISLEKND